MSMKKDTRQAAAGTSAGAAGVDRAQNTRGTAIRLLRKLMEQKGKLLIVFFSILIGSLFNILAPKVMGEATNQIVRGIQNALKNGKNSR